MYVTLLSLLFPPLIAGPSIDLTTLLLLVISSLPSTSTHITALARSSAFISGVGVYISHNDPSVRRCGMLAAEIIAGRANKKLAFGGWDGDDEGRPWARALRVLIEERDVDADMDLSGLHVPDVKGDIAPDAAPKIDHTTSPAATSDAVTGVVLLSGYDSDDSLTGYASPDTSRAGSPTPSELEEIEKDPTLNVGKKKVPRPVYLAQLGELLRPTSALKAGDDTEADRIDMGLKVAEELIRRKRDYGTELGMSNACGIKLMLIGSICLEENAVNLVYGLVGLVNNYELDNFNQLRQGALIALVACCPQKAAP
jgi:telomere length regulation protein